LKAEEMLRELKRQEELRANVKIIDPMEEEDKKKKNQQVEKEELEKVEKNKNKKEQKDDVDVGESSQLGKVGGVFWNVRDGRRRSWLQVTQRRTHSLRLLTTPWTTIQNSNRSRPSHQRMG
jgi:hypothetical protein